MSTVTASSKTDIRPTFTISRDRGSAAYAPAIGRTYSWGNGTGANQINEMFDDDRTLASGANETLALTGDTTFLNPDRQPINFTGVKEFYLYNQSATETLTVGDAAADEWLGPFASAITIPPGGIAHFVNPSAAGWPVSGAAKNLKIANSGGGAATFTLYLGGIV